jgi:glucans biosynthesis protein C
METIGAWLERRLSGPGVVLWPVVWLAVARVLLVERFESTHALVDDWYNHAQYLPIFLLGALVASRNSVWDAMQRMRWVCAGLAIAGYIFIVWYFYASGYGDDDLPPDALRMLQRAVWALLQWTAIAAILGFVRGIAFRDGAALRYLREAVFPIYILHQTVIVILAHNAQPLDLPPVVEGPLLVMATFGLCFLGFEIVRRARWLRPLFGLKANVPRDAGSNIPNDTAEPALTKPAPHKA